MRKKAIMEVRHRVDKQPRSRELHKQSKKLRVPEKVHLL